MSVNEARIELIDEHQVKWKIEAASLVGFRWRLSVFDSTVSSKGEHLSNHLDKITSKDLKVITEEHHYAMSSLITEFSRKL